MKPSSKARKLVAKRLFNEGVKAYEEGKIEKALEFFMKACCYDVNDYRHWNNLGASLLSLGYILEFFTVLFELLKLKKTFDEKVLISRKFIGNLGLMKILKGDFSEEDTKAIIKSIFSLMKMANWQRSKIFKAKNYKQYLELLEDNYIISEVLAAIGFSHFVQYIPFLIFAIDGFRGISALPFSLISKKLNKKPVELNILYDNLKTPNYTRFSITTKSMEKKIDEIFEKQKKQIEEILSSLEEKEVNIFKNDNEIIEHLNSILKENVALVYIFSVDKILFIIFLTKHRGELRKKIKKIFWDKYIPSYYLLRLLKSLDTIQHRKSSIKKEAIEKLLKNYVPTSFVEKDALRTIMEVYYDSGEKILFSDFIDRIFKIIGTELADIIDETATEYNVNTLLIVTFGDIINFPIHSLETSQEISLIEKYFISYTFPPLITNKINSINSKTCLLLGSKEFVMQDKEIIRNILDKDWLIAEITNAEKFLKETGEYRILHISAHGESSDDDPLKSYIKLNRGNILTPLDILNSQLKVQDVIFASCLVGFRPKLGLDIAFGFPYAFMAKGVRSIVMPIYQIDNNGVSKFLKPYYEILSRNNNPIEAFREACVKAIQENYKEWRYIMLYKNILWG